MKLFGRSRKNVEDASVTVVVWPDDTIVDVDDDDFARAIARGRENELDVRPHFAADDEGLLSA